MNPEISVNICCYNSEKFINDTLESILQQTYSDFELIIINDGSIDNTEKIIKSYNDKRIKYFYQENKGLSISRNKAISLSQGEFIAFIDHDDIWLPQKLEKQIVAFKKNPDVGFVHSNFYIDDYIGNIQHLAYSKLLPDGFIFKESLCNYQVGILTAMVKKSVILSLDSLFDPRLHIAEDYDLFLRIFYKNKVCYLAEPLAVYKKHSDMSTLNLYSKIPFELDLVLNKFSAIYGNFTVRYSSGVKKIRKRINYLEAWANMAKGELKAVRSHPEVMKSFDIKLYCLYLASFLPVKTWFYLWNLWSILTNNKKTKDLLLSSLSECEWKD